MKKLLDIHDMNHPGITGDEPITFIMHKFYSVKDLKKSIKKNVRRKKGVT